MPQPAESWVCVGCVHDADGVSCERPFSEWLLVQGVVGIVVFLYAAVLLSKSCTSNGAKQVHPAQKVPSRANSDEDDAERSELRW